MKSTRITLLAGWFLLSASMLLAGNPPVFEEQNGLVVIEMESAETYHSWNLQSSIAGYTDSGYLHYEGNNYFGNPGNSLLTFKVYIHKTGQYRFQWHSRIAKGNDGTEHNDSWLRFPDASDFYATKGNHTVYPGGSGKTPNPVGSSSDNWFKVYQNTLNNWSWNASTSDHDPHDIFVDFDTPGMYTIEISGRSNGHAINRFVLYHKASVGSNVALSLNEPESPRYVVSLEDDIQIKDLKIAPNPATNIAQVILSGMSGETFNYQLIDASGKVIRKASHLITLQEEKLELQISGLPAGMYFLQGHSDKEFFKGSFLKN